MLNEITICCIDTKNKIDALVALDKSINKLFFKRYIYFTDYIDKDIKLSRFKNISNIDLEIIKIQNIKNINEYSKFCLVDLNNYIETNFCLLIQHDGYIINPDCWKNEFLNFDYIGAPWPNKEYINRVGNGGFSLRSKKFLETTAKIFKEYPNITVKNNHPDRLNEDFLACNLYYHEMISSGIKFSDTNTASLFSIEHPIPEIKQKTFGFHGNFIKRN